MKIYNLSLISLLILFLSVNCFAQTRNIVPRGTSEGYIGLSTRTWAGMYADGFVGPLIGNVTGDLTGNADTATSVPASGVDLSTVTTALSTKVDLTETSSVTLQSNLGVGGTLDVTGNINTAEYYQIDGSTMVAILPGTNSIAYGVGAGSSNITGGDYNTFIGNYAGQANSTGDNNSFLGYYAGYSNTTGGNNSFVGFQAGYKNTTGANNSFLGYYAGYSNTAGANNSFLGSYAGLANTTGANNSFVGYKAGYYNTTGAGNSFVGGNAGQANTTGANNSFVGFQAGYKNTTGGNNSFVGFQAGYKNTTGAQNSFLGYAAGYYNITGAQNSFLGYRAGASNGTGDNNLLLGWQAGDSITSGSDNIIIGYDEDTPSATTSNYLNIGGLIVGDMATSSATVLGELHATEYYGDGSNLTNVDVDVDVDESAKYNWTDTHTFNSTTTFKDVIETTGKVGISTGTTPSFLSVYSDGNYGIRVTNAYDGAYVERTGRITRAYGGGLLFDNGTIGDLIYFRVSNAGLVDTVAMTIESDGDIIIGEDLAVSGSFKPYQRTDAQLDALEPSEAGLLFMCTDCAIPYSVCVSTGTGAGALVLMNTVNNCE